jgi:hypothetical protein
MRSFLLGSLVAIAASAVLALTALSDTRAVLPR